MFYIFVPETTKQLKIDIMKTLKTTQDFYKATLSKIDEVSGKELKDMRFVIDKNYGKWPEGMRVVILNKIDKKLAA